MPELFKDWDVKDTALLSAALLATFADIETSKQAGARGGQVESTGATQFELRLHQARGRGEQGIVGRRGRDDYEINLAGRHPRLIQSAAPGRRGQTRGRFPF